MYVCSIGCNVQLQFEGNEEGFPNTHLYALFRAAQGGLTNIQKHAAASQVDLKVYVADDCATLELVDNGRGFDTVGLETLAANPERSFGFARRARTRRDCARQSMRTSKA